MINVLFLINNLGNGGAERVLVNLVNNMDYSKYQVTLRTLVNEGVNRRNLSEHVKYEFVFKNTFKGINYLYLLPQKYIYNKVAHGSFDVIIVYLHGVLTKIISYSPLHQKTIAYLHADMEKSKFIKTFSNRQLVRECFGSYNAIVSVSKHVQKSFEKACGINDNLKVIYNTFDIENINSLSKEQVESAIFDRKKINICSVGKLNQVKGYDRLLRVVKKLKMDRLSFTLTIVGDGPMRKDLEDYIKENNLSEHVYLVGFDNNPYRYLGKSDLFVCSSLTEGFSSVVVESIILGIPVITTNCAGMSEILGDNNDYGIIVDNNEESLYLGIKDLIFNGTKLEFYKQKAIIRSKFFESNTSVKSVENLIEEVIK